MPNLPSEPIEFEDALEEADARQLKRRRSKSVHVQRSTGSHAPNTEDDEGLGASARDDLSIGGPGTKQDHAAMKAYYKRISRLSSRQ